MNFYDTEKWIKLRYRFLRTVERQCLCCGNKNPKTEFHVDHIKPRCKYPELEYDIKNLQLLCRRCNLGKGGDYEDDWKTLNAPKPYKADLSYKGRLAHIKRQEDMGFVIPPDDKERYLRQADDYEPFESHLPVIEVIN